MLLESISGFYRADMGIIRVNKIDVCSIKPEYRQIGFVYQDFGLFPHMSVYENIIYGLRMHKVKKKKADAVVQEMVNIMGISKILEQYPATLSGGERQRAALARTLVLNPKVLLMDEPFSALDPNTRCDMYELVKSIHKKFCCTIIFVTHDFQEAQYMANRIGIMINGEMRYICKAEDLCKICGDDEIKEFVSTKLNIVSI